MPTKKRKAPAPKALSGKERKRLARRNAIAAQVNGSSSSEEEPPSIQPPSAQLPSAQPPEGVPPAAQPPEGVPPAAQPPEGVPPAAQPSVEELPVEESPEEEDLDAQPSVEKSPEEEDLDAQPSVEESPVEELPEEGDEEAAAPNEEATATKRPAKSGGRHKKQTALPDGWPVLVYLHLAKPSNAYRDPVPKLGAEGSGQLIKHTDFNKDTPFSEVLNAIQGHVISHGHKFFSKYPYVRKKYSASIASSSSGLTECKTLMKWQWALQSVGIRNKALVVVGDGPSVEPAELDVEDGNHVRIDVCMLLKRDDEDESSGGSGRRRGSTSGGESDAPAATRRKKGRNRKEFPTELEVQVHDFIRGDKNGKPYAEATEPLPGSFRFDLMKYTAHLSEVPRRSRVPVYDSEKEVEDEDQPTLDVSLSDLFYRTAEYAIKSHPDTFGYDTKMLSYKARFCLQPSHGRKAMEEVKNDEELSAFLLSHARKGKGQYLSDGLLKVSVGFDGVETFDSLIDQEWIDAGPSGPLRCTQTEKEKIASKMTGNDRQSKSKRDVMFVEDWLKKCVTAPDSPVLDGLTKQMKRHLIGRLTVEPSKIPRQWPPTLTFFTSFFAEGSRGWRVSGGLTPRKGAYKYNATTGEYKDIPPPAGWLEGGRGIGSGSVGGSSGRSVRGGLDVFSIATSVRQAFGIGGNSAGGGGGSQTSSGSRIDEISVGVSSVAFPQYSDTVVVRRSEEGRLTLHQLLTERVSPRTGVLAVEEGITRETHEMVAVVQSPDGAHDIWDHGQKNTTIKALRRRYGYGLTFSVKVKFVRLVDPSHGNWFFQPPERFAGQQHG